MYSIINFTKEAVVLSIQCDNEEDLKDGFARLSQLTGETVKYEDLDPHDLKNGSKYQVVVGPDYLGNVREKLQKIASNAYKLSENDGRIELARALLKDLGDSYL